MSARRKGKRRPPTVGRDCVYVRYADGIAVCAKKIHANELREDDVKYGCTKAYDDISCDKCKYCWYEPADSKTVSELKARLSKELADVKSAVKRLETALENCERRSDD